MSADDQRVRLAREDLAELLRIALNGCASDVAREIHTRRAAWINEVLDKLVRERAELTERLYEARNAGRHE